MVVPALWVQSHKPRGYWPIKFISHHRLLSFHQCVTNEQLWAAVSATDSCEVVIVSGSGGGGAGDVDVIAGDALVISPGPGSFAALCCNCRQLHHGAQVSLRMRSAWIKSSTKKTYHNTYVHLVEVNRPKLSNRSCIL